MNFYKEKQDVNICIEMPLLLGYEKSNFITEPLIYDTQLLE